MSFFDVIFPLNIGSLTYKCPTALSGVLKTGMIVSTPLKNKTTKGVIEGKSSIIPPGEVKDIQAVYGDEPVLSSKMITLLKWMSEYYLAEKGLVLKNMLPKEAFSKVKQRDTKTFFRPSFLKVNWKDYIFDINNSISATISKSLHKDTYKTFLLHAPSSMYEYSFLITILSEIKNAIILLPEVSLVNTFYPILNERFGERICLFHSGLSRGKRSGAIEKILSGQSDIILGTRSAVFAPLKKVTLIAVLHEHSSSYKQENLPCYSGRDVAVMRGFLEKTTVLLSSICPSIESLYNCKSGKYTLLKPSDYSKKPRVRIIDMRYEKRIKPYLSRTVTHASGRYIKNAKKVMFVVNRRGHSTLLKCSDCNHIEQCPHCKIPLVFHKQDMSVKCHYCGYTLSEVPESCSHCKGYNLELLGAGTQRVQEDLENILGIKTLRLDSDKARIKSDLEDVIGSLSQDDKKIIIGTKLMARRLNISKKYSMSAILNPDVFLNFPDFRSSEKAYQEISSIIDQIEPDGEIFIQTRMPQNDLFKSLKNYDYTTFFKEELQRRKSLNYPPFSRLVLIKCVSKMDLSGELSKIADKADSDIEILGPYATKNRKRENEYKLLLKSSVRGKLHSVAKSLIRAFKDSKDVKIKADVDPIMI